ncbi:hypothetical protein KY362_03170 [Candidatus Woesearchaeota archaeon]|nr:hypothetical protein [Candidatus Woesearchaeota archaeon]
MSGFHGWKNYVSKMKTYEKPEASEWRGLIITVVLLGFIFSFRDWGVETFDVAMGIQNLLISIVIVAISYFFHQLAIRSFSIMRGYRVQFKMWFLGLIIGLVVIFVSNGYLFFLATGGVYFTFLEIHRLGKLRYATHYRELGWSAMSGAIVCMLLAVISKSLFVSTGFAVFHKAMIINIWIALFDMIPIPPFNGSKTFFGSRYVYMLVTGSLVGCAALLMFGSGLITIIGGLVIGILACLVFFVYIDKNWKVK